MNAIPPKSENEKPKSEPKITQTRAPILATRLGRGRLGGSTICDFLVQRARIAGRPVTVADGDLLNPTLAGLYPPGAPGEATRPKSAQPAHVGEWIEDLVHQMMQTSTTRWKNGPYLGVSHAARGFPVLVHLKGLARVRLK